MPEILKYTCKQIYFELAFKVKCWEHKSIYFVKSLEKSYYIALYWNRSPDFLLSPC